MNSSINILDGVVENDMNNNSSTVSYMNATNITHALVVHNWAAYDFNIVECGTEENIDVLLEEYTYIVNKISNLVGQNGKIWNKSDIIQREYSKDFILGYLCGNMSTNEYIKALELVNKLDKVYGQNIFCDYPDLHFTKVEFKR